MAATEQQFGLLGLTEAQLASLLDEMDKACRDTIVNQKRRSVRKPFRSVNEFKGKLGRQGIPDKNVAGPASEPDTAEPPPAGN